MPKIVLFGGSSALGRASALALQEMDSSYSEIVSFVRDKSFDCDSELGESVIWSTESSQEVLNAIDKIEFNQGDCAIIAIGVLQILDMFEAHNNKPNAIDVFKAIQVNYSLPTLVLIETVKRLAQKGGGDILLFSSAAAFPPLEPNSLYASSKLGLDSFALSIQNSASKLGVNITVVRPGFVPTPLNSGRKPTPFSTSVKKTAQIAVGGLGKRIVWIPKILALITAVINCSRFLQKIASSKFMESHRST